MNHIWFYQHRNQTYEYFTLNVEEKPCKQKGKKAEIPIKRKKAKLLYT